MSEKIPANDITEEVPQEFAEIDLYQKREKIYTRKIEGFFQRLRVFTGWPLLIGYFSLPWLSWGDRQAILFDLPARKFHILGLTLWPQDFPLLAWVLIISAFALFLVTKLFGRVWCGYSCPQTVWTSMFMWIEQRTEGTRNQRIKLDKGSWTSEKILKKSIKHAMWLGLAFYTAFTFVAYFTPANELIFSFFDLSVNLWAATWIGIFTLLTYLNAGWLREQVCLHMCPYARFQSAMFDSNTLIVSYDSQRGEPRGSRKKNVDPKSLELGDCVDCELCVQVCPTGIDIRDGLQYECISCTHCIDACDSVMDKMGYARGLISYTTENFLKGVSKNKYSFLRPATLGYFAAIMLMVGVFSWYVYSRVPLDLDIIRDRTQLYQERGEFLENNYTARIMNMTEEAQQLELSILDSGELQLDKVSILGNTQLSLAAGELAEIPFRISIPKSAAKTPVISLNIEVRSLSEPNLQAEKVTNFLSPGNVQHD